jgi:hypothetical protein
MTTIHIDTLRWHEAIENAKESYYDTYYKIGGLLSLAVLCDEVDIDTINRSFDIVREIHF